MKKGKLFILKLFIFLIFFSFTDGGRSLVLVSYNIQLVFHHHHSADLEVPHQNSSVNCNYDEKEVGSFRFDFACISKQPVVFQSALAGTSHGFSDSVWQPPEFI